MTQDQDQELPDPAQDRGTDERAARGARGNGNPDHLTGQSSGPSTAIPSRSARPPGSIPGRGRGLRGGGSNG
jgi:hypothetical protein